MTTEATNATVSIPAFTVGTTSPVVVTATKIDQTVGASMTVRATDVAGNVTMCDPAMVTVNGRLAGVVKLFGLAERRCRVTRLSSRMAAS